jgi:hypothetical protein
VIEVRQLSADVLAFLLSELLENVRLKLRYRNASESTLVHVRASAAYLRCTPFLQDFAEASLVAALR